MIPTNRRRYVEILEFTHFVTFFSFNKIGENHKQKILVKKVTVVVALVLGMGNTKNPDNERKQQEGQRGVAYAGERKV